MSNTVKMTKATRPPFDWTYLLLMALIGLGLIILTGLVIELPIWLFSHR